MNSLMCRRENAKRSRGSFIVTTSKNTMHLCFLWQHNINLRLHFSFWNGPFSIVTAKHLLSNGKTHYSEFLCIYRIMWIYEHLHPRFWTTNSVRNMKKKSAESIWQKSRICFKSSHPIQQINSTIFLYKPENLIHWPCP